MPKTITAALRQTGMFGQSTEFRIIGGKKLQVVRSGKSNPTFQINLLALSERSRLCVRVPWLWLFATMLLGLLILVFINFQPLSGGVLHNYQYVLMAVFALLLFACFFLFIIGFYRRRVFYSRSTNIPIFEIRVGKPDLRSYQQFIDHLIKGVNEAHNFRELKPEQQLAGELKTLRRLQEVGVVSQSDYARARDRVFAFNNNKGRSIK